MMPPELTVIVTPDTMVTVIPDGMVTVSVDVIVMGDTPPTQVSGSFQFPV